MKKYTSYDDLWKDFEQQESFQIEKIILEFTLQLHQLMVKRKISKTDLARIIGYSPAYITKIFHGKANFTIASMVKLSNALDGKITIHVTGKEEIVKTWFRTIDGNKKPLPQWNIKPDEVLIYEKTPLTIPKYRPTNWCDNQILENAA